MFCIEDNSEVGATCGTIVNGEYIYWTSWRNGDLYKYDLKNNIYLKVKSMQKMNLNGKTFSCTLKRRDRLYLISLFDGYEIVEYNLKTNQLRLLYQKCVKGIYVFNAFLIDEKIYMFPSQLDVAICVYSLLNKTVEYKKWEELLPNDLITTNNLVFSMDCINSKIYGTIQNTSIYFELYINEAMQCKVNLINGYRLNSINVYGDNIYITLMDQEKFICINNETLNITQLKEEEKKGDNNFFSSVIQYNSKLFFIPSIGCSNIHVYDMQTGMNEIIEYLPDFCRKEEKSRLFWLPNIHNNKMFLLPHTSNRILEIDMDDCNVKYHNGLKNSLKDFINIECFKSSNEKIEKKDNVGANINNVILNN